MRWKMSVGMPKSIENGTKQSEFAVFWNKNDEYLELMLYGTVGDEYSQADALSISRVLAEHRHLPVVMRINSMGGLAYDGLAIYNAITQHPAKTTAIIESVAFSAASIAAIGADEVAMYSNATYGIHQGLTMAYGHIADMKDAIEWLEQFNQAAAVTYSAKTGKTIGEIEQAMLGEHGNGTKFTAAEALSWGFVDRIIDAGGTQKKAKKPASAASTDRVAALKLKTRLTAAMLQD